MKVKVKKSKGKTEASIFDSMVADPSFLKAYCHFHRPDLFVSSYGAWLSDACVAFHKAHGSAPGRESILEVARKALKGNRIPEETFSSMVEFIKSVGEQPHCNNSSHMTKKAAEYLAIRAFKRLKAELEVALERDDPALCEKAISNLKKVAVMSGQKIDPFNVSKERLREAFLRDTEPLFKLPGDLGKMLNSQLKLKRFLAIIAKAKSGKTALLYYMATVAKRCGNNVAVFAAGDEDEDSSILRWAVMMTGKNNEKEFCGTQAVPVMDCDKNQTGLCNLPKRRKRNNGALMFTDEERKKLTPEDMLEKEPNYCVCTCCRNIPNSNFKPAIWYKYDTVEQLSWPEAHKAFTRFHKVTPNRRIRLFTYSSDELTVSEMRRTLEVEEDNTGWVPTVVIADYPDLFADEKSGEAEFRHKENKKWKALRGLSQNKSILLIVVTQSNMGGYKSTSLDATNVNEDRRKLDHPTGIYAIHQTPIEQKKKVARFGPVLQRRGRLVPGRQVVVLQALERGRFYKDSFFTQLNLEEEK
jgi:hypothetical protein